MMMKTTIPTRTIKNGDEDDYGDGDDDDDADAHDDEADDAADDHAHGDEGGDDDDGDKMFSRLDC